MDAGTLGTVRARACVFLCVGLWTHNRPACSGRGLPISQPVCQGGERGGDRFPMPSLPAWRNRFSQASNLHLRGVHVHTMYVPT